MNIKQQVYAAIEADREYLTALGRELFHMPELGYKETATARRVMQEMEKAGFRAISRCGLTGVKAAAGGGGPCVAIIGELDAVPAPGHPAADPDTGAAHACGHSAQLAAMLGAGRALRPVLGQLGGRLCLLATPAEEFIEIDYRLNLKQQGHITRLGGKQQLIAESAFDDIDIVIMAHAKCGSGAPQVVVHGSSLGFTGKSIRFLGKAAHAGAAPWEGVNALNAASLAITAIHHLRETFCDQDMVRVHPIITKGGDAVNTVPHDVRMECFVRAANLPALRDASARVDRAIEGACHALGAGVEIKTIPGYMPLEQNHRLGEVFAQNAANLLGEGAVARGLPFSGSTDMGDVSWLLPAIHPTVNGFGGTLHGADFCVLDEELAYVTAAKLLAGSVTDLLAQNAALAREIIGAQPRKAKDEYTAVWG